MLILLLIILIISILVSIKKSQVKNEHKNVDIKSNSAPENSINYSTKTESQPIEYTNKTDNYKLCEDSSNNKNYTVAKSAASYNYPLSSILCFDTETTGLYAGRDEILQLAIIDGNGKVLFNELIKPKRRKRWPEAQEIHRITPDMVKNKKTLLDYEDKIHAIFNRASIIVGYNLEFDLEFLKKGGIDLAEDGFNSDYYYDVMKEFAPIYGQYDSYHGDYKYKKLTICARYYKYKWDRKAHDALEDAKATLHCYLVMNGLKEMPITRKQEKTDKPSYQTVWKEFSKNKVGKKIDYSDFYNIVGLIKKWVKKEDSNENAITYNLLSNKRVVYIRFNKHLILEVRMPKTMNYIKMTSEMKESVEATNDILDMLCFYNLSDFENNNQLKNFVINKIKAFEKLI